MLVTAVAAGCPAIAQATPHTLFGQDARPGREQRVLDDFNQHWRAQVYAVYQTESFDDDEALIRAMMGGVDRVVVDPAGGKRHYLGQDWQARMYRASMLLARSAEGQEVLALDIQFAAQRALPLHRWFYEAPPLEHYALWYEQAGRDERRAHADGYIAMLLERSSALQREGEIVAALSATRTALSAARATDSGWEPVLRDRERELQLGQREYRRIEQYQRRQDAGRATDEIVAALAIWEFLVDADTDAAIALAQGIDDGELAAKLTAAARAADGMPASEALELAQWFAQIAEDPSVRLDAMKASAMQVSCTNYRRFLATHDKQDAARLVAQQALTEMSERIEALAPSRSTPPPARWKSITGQLLEVDGDDKGNLLWGYGGFEVHGESIAIGNARLNIPLHVGCDYDFRMTVKLTRSDRLTNVGVFLPVNNMTGALFILGRDGGLNFLEGVGQIEDLAGFMFARNRVVDLRFAVRSLTNGRSRLMLWVDGTQVYDWSGAAADLGISEHDTGLMETQPSIMLGADSVFEYSSIEVRPIWNDEADADAVE